MPKRLRLKDEITLLVATYRGPLPSDFPIGSPESRAAARALLDHQKSEPAASQLALLGELNEYELATSEGYEGLEKVCMVQLARMAQERSEVYGITLLTPEEIRRRRKDVAERAARDELVEAASSNLPEEGEGRSLG